MLCYCPFPQVTSLVAPAFHSCYESCRGVTHKGLHSMGRGRSSMLKPAARYSHELSLSVDFEAVFRVVLTGRFVILLNSTGESAGTASLI